MRYLLLIYGAEDALPRGEEARERMMAAHRALIAGLRADGTYRASEALRPVAVATSVRSGPAAVAATDGPFAETKEQLAGFYLIDCPDLDYAIACAGRIPNAAWGTIEIRPIMEHGVDLAAVRMPGAEA